jgi:hypothetical protein
MWTPHFFSEPCPDDIQLLKNRKIESPWKEVLEGMLTDWTFEPCPAILPFHILS